MPDPTDSQVKEILEKYRKIAVIGLSPKPHRASHGVTSYLIQQGYDCVGVRPGASEILEIPVYETIGDVPGSLEIVDVFRNSKIIPELIETLIALQPKVIWLQEGVTAPASEEKARESGIFVVSDRCILKEHQRLGVSF